MEAVYVQKADAVNYKTATLLSVNDVVPFAQNIGIANNDALVDETIAVSVVGVFAINAKTADVIAAGDSLYFDVVNRELTTTDTHTQAGYAFTPKEAGVVGSVDVKIG